VDEPDLGVATRQCTSSLVVPCAQFSGEKRNDRCIPATLLSRFGSSRLFLFPKLKSTLKGRHFDTFDEIQKHSTKDLFAIPKEAFKIWQKRWERCVTSEGNYFEGDKLEKVVSINIKFLLHQSGLLLIKPCIYSV
jgi:hypothetical protein